MFILESTDKSAVFSSLYSGDEIGSETERFEASKSSVMYELLLSFAIVELRMLSLECSVECKELLLLKDQSEIDFKSCTRMLIVYAAPQPSPIPNEEDDGSS